MNGAQNLFGYCEHEGTVLVCGHRGGAFSLDFLPHHGNWGTFLGPGVGNLPISVQCPGVGRGEGWARLELTDALVSLAYVLVWEVSIAGREGALRLNPGAYRCR